MADSLVPDKQKSNDLNKSEYDWQMYLLLVEELRHLHTVWMDNFRVILTFNSILLPGTFAVFAIAMLGDISTEPAMINLSIIFIIVLSIVGAITSSIMILIIQRVKAFTVLRQTEVRNLEKRIAHLLPVHPFIEGYIFGGGSISLPEHSLVPNVKPMRRNWFDSLIGYTLIGLGFIVAYLLLGVITYSYWIYLP